MPNGVNSPKKITLSELKKEFQKADFEATDWRDTRISGTVTTTSFDKLTEKIVDGPYKGLSHLWLLAKTGNPFFYKVFHKFAVKFIHILYEQPQEGPFKGQSIFWLLMNARTKATSPGENELFSDFWDIIRLHLGFFSHLRQEALGKSVLWFLANSNNSRYFLQVRHQFPLLTLRDLLQQPIEDSDKGKSLLWLLSVNHPELFLQVWDRYQDQIVLSDLCLAEDKENLLSFLKLWAKSDGRAFRLIWEKCKDHILLPHLGFPFAKEPGLFVESLPQPNDAAKDVAYRFEKGYQSDKFELLWEKFEPEFTIAHFRETVRTENIFAKKVLWLLAFAAAHGETKPFELVLKKMQSEITLAELREQPLLLSNGKNFSIMALLAMAVSKGYETPFLEVLKKYDADFSLEDLRQVGGHANGNAILWLLACGTRHAQTAAFLYVWEKFKRLLTIKDLCKQSKCDEDIEISVLHLLAEGWHMGSPEPFLKVWEMKSSQVPSFVLRQQIKGTSLITGQSLLWALAKTSAHLDGNKLFFTIIANFKQKLKVSDFCIKAPEAAPKNHSLLNVLFDKYLFCQEFAKEFADDFKTLICDIFTQLPGAIPNSIINYESGAFCIRKSLRTVDFGQMILDLLGHKNDFCNALEVADRAQDHSEATLYQLVILAQKANAIGYVGAFFELGQWLFKTGKEDLAYKAYAKVPETSIFYQEAQLLLAEEDFAEGAKRIQSLLENQALSEEKIPEGKLKAVEPFFEKSLEKGLKTSESHQFIQRIGSIISSETFQDNMLSDTVSAELACEKGITREKCFARFYEIKKQQAKRTFTATSEAFVAEERKENSPPPSSLS